MDVLVISTINGGCHHYYIVEAKNGKFGFRELKQLLLYIDLFRQRPIFRTNRDKVFACALASAFDKRTVMFRNLHSTCSPYDSIILIQYKPANQARDAVFSQLPIGAISLPKSAAIVPLPWGSSSPMKDISSNVSSGLPCCPNTKYIVRSIKEQPSPNSFIIKEDSTLTKSTISICYAFVWDKVFSASDFHTFLNILYQDIAPTVSYNFRAINPVIISRGYKPVTLNYIASYNTLSVRRPISVFHY
jgi:hypothetical protein